MSKEKTLTPEEVKLRLVLSEAELTMLDQIASGQAPRNAVSILRAIELKLKHTLPSADPKAEPLTVVVNTEEKTEGKPE
jgi:hypothetical protein